jgi:hypothetical protein
METLIFRARPDDRNACDQWTLVRDADDPEGFVIEEHVRAWLADVGKALYPAGQAHDGGRVLDDRAARARQRQVAGNFRGALSFTLKVNLYHHC